MSPTEEFQKLHGARWAAITNGPELHGALLAINAEPLNELIQLSPEQIASPSGNVLLARLQGWLLHKRALVDLSIVEKVQGDDLPPPDYPDPMAEAAEEARADQQDTATGAHHSSLLQEFIADQTVAEPLKPKRKYRKRRKRKTKNASNSRTASSGSDT